MSARRLWRAATGLLAPPLCGACAQPCSASATVCGVCMAALAAAGGGTTEVAGLGAVTWAAPYRGIGRDLVTALKFGHRLQIAELLAERIAAALGPGARAGAVTAVPAAAGRRRSRGFDPAELIAGALAQVLGLPVALCLRRADGPRQVGRSRAQRLADPMEVWSVGPCPEDVLLVDDVLTTGATIRACAAALRASGAERVQAAVFARALGPGRRRGVGSVAQRRKETYGANRGQRSQPGGDRGCP